MSAVQQATEAVASKRENEAVIVTGESVTLEQIELREERACGCICYYEPN